MESLPAYCWSESPYLVDVVGARTTIDARKTKNPDFPSNLVVDPFDWQVLLDETSWKERICHGPMILYYWRQQYHPAPRRRVGG